ncbi:MAG: endo-1,4-beta-xylanase [Bacteroidia bacterium]|nr:endo-1,4-beta-xylanase [Bacteroidia bacterium]
MNNLRLISVFVLLFFWSCHDDTVVTCDHLNNHLVDHLDFPCGVVTEVNLVDQNGPYRDIVMDQFNSVTAENIMKPDYLHPAEGVYYWADADRLADFCLENGKRLHGHTLIWHLQLPDWITYYEGSMEDWDRLLKDHIYQIVGRYKGVVASWDVVNEAFNDDGTIRNSVWKQHLGPGYIEKAFQYAHEADPDAKLFYNDYSIALNPAKRKAIIDYMNSLKAKGIPIHGIGLQMHIFNGFPEDLEITRAIDDVWKNDYLVHISELDVSVNPLSREMPFAPENELNRQAERYLHVFRTYNQIPDKFKFGITVWGVSDRESWIPYFFNRDDYPLLFDDQYLPKPAFCKLISNL